MSFAGDYLVFTALDDALLSTDNYSFEAARPALELLRRKSIPLILNSAKTRAEIEMWRRKLANHNPFISENGGAVFIPEDYFPFEFEHSHIDEESGLIVIQLGTSREILEQALADMRNLTGLNIKSFLDMTVEEVAKICRMSKKEAELALRREYDEPFILDKEPTEEEWKHILQIVSERGLRCHRERRFFHLSGNHDKGEAMSILKLLFRKAFPKIKTIALGDSDNDFSMLKKAETSVLIKGPDGKYPEFNIAHLRKAKAKGPEGWNNEILHLIKG